MRKKHRNEFQKKSVLFVRFFKIHRRFKKYDVTSPPFKKFFVSDFLFFIKRIWIPYFYLLFPYFFHHNIMVYPIFFITLNMCMGNKRSGERGLYGIWRTFHGSSFYTVFFCRHQKSVYVSTNYISASFSTNFCNIQKFSKVRCHHYQTGCSTVCFIKLLKILHIYFFYLFFQEKNSSFVNSYI